MSQSIKMRNISRFVAHWNSHSYDTIKGINHNRFVSYDHFLAYIANQIRHGTFDRHSQIKLDSPPRALVLSTYNHYNYVFCASAIKSAETIYDVMRELSKSSRRWVIDLVAIRSIRDLLFWVLPFIVHHNVIEFDYEGKHYDVSANICVITGQNTTAIPVAPWAEKVPWEQLAFVVTPNNINLLISVFAGRGRDDFTVYIAEALIPRHIVSTEDVIIGDEHITLSLRNLSDMILANRDNIVNSDLPSDLWPYHPTA